MTTNESGIEFLDAFERAEAAYDEALATYRRMEIIV